MDGRNGLRGAGCVKTALRGLAGGLWGWGQSRTWGIAVQKLLNRTVDQLGAVPAPGLGQRIQPLEEKGVYPRAYKGSGDLFAMVSMIQGYQKSATSATLVLQVTV